jgi:hypothetical protein
MKGRRKDNPSDRICMRGCLGFDAMVYRTQGNVGELNNEYQRG